MLRLPGAISKTKRKVKKKIYPKKFLIFFQKNFSLEKFLYPFERTFFLLCYDGCLFSLLRKLSKLKCEISKFSLIFQKMMFYQNKKFFIVAHAFHLAHSTSLTTRKNILLVRKNRISQTKIFFYSYSKVLFFIL